MSRSCCHLAIGFMLLVCSHPTTADERIELLDGTTINASISSIGSDGELAGDQLETSVDIADLRTVVRSSRAPSAATGPIVVDWAEGGRLTAKEFTLAEETCKIDWGPEGSFKVPIDVIRAVRFDSKAPMASFQTAVEKSTAGADRLFAKADGRIQPITGLISDVGAETVIFLREGAEIRLPRTQVYGIVLADVAGANVGGARSRVTLQDGSIVPGTLAKLANGVLTLKMTRDTEISVPWDAVTRIDIQSPRLTYLSDMTPAEVVQQSIVAISRPWKRDQNVTGQALALNTTEEQTTKVVEFQKGVGTHSRCRLTYEIDGDYETFLATVGIDAGTQGKGDCTATVLGDGQLLRSMRLTGQDRMPQEIRIDVAGLRRLTIAVEPGRDLDLADHVNWCDARLIRKPSP